MSRYACMEEDVPAPRVGCSCRACYDRRLTDRKAHSIGLVNRPIGEGTRLKTEVIVAPTAAADPIEPGITSIAA